MQVIAQSISPNDLLDTNQASAVLGLSPNTLNAWRCNKSYNLPFIKVGRYVRYRRSDLAAFLDSRRIGEIVKVA